MRASEVLSDGFDRVFESVPALLEGMSVDDLARRPEPGANPVGWLVWHLLRVHDDHVAGVTGQQQVWTADGWHERSGLPFDAAEIGYGQSAEEVGAVRLDAELLAGYSEAVHARTAQVLAAMSDADLDVVVDDSWDPPVTAGVRLVSVLGDCLQHVGQAGYVRGLLQRQGDAD